MFSGDAINLIYEVAFCRAPNALNALLFMKEVYFNDRGNQTGQQSALLMVRADREPGN